MNQYELVMILTPVLSEEEVKKTVDRYKDFVTENGAEMIHEEAWGLKQLAYPIQKKTTGIYYLLEYKAPGDVNGKLDILFGRDDNVIRFLTTRLDKYGIEYAEKRRRGEVGPKRKAAAKAAAAAETEAQEETKEKTQA